MEICTFWHGERLRTIDDLCLRSMISAGFRVRLYCYQPVANVPADIEICDAAEILPTSVFARVDPDDPDGRHNTTIVQFSDIFRIALMKRQKGFWLDTDMFVLRPFEVPTDRPFLARENRDRLGVSAMYFPPDHPVIAEFDRFLASDSPLPEWLGWRRGILKPVMLQLRGKPVKPTSVGVTVFGNDGISRLGRRHGFFEDAAPKDTFYALTGRQTERFFDPDFDFRSLFRPDIFGLHVHRKIRAELPPEPGSMFAWALETTGTTA